MLSGVSLVTLVGYMLAFEASGRGSGVLGALAAMLLAVSIVLGLTGWIMGMVLAVRAQSLLWLLVVLLLGPPTGPLACALWVRPQPSSRRPS